MPLSDSSALRETLSHLFPAINIEQAIPTPSGQRLVYFCSFSDNTDVPAQTNWYKWGPVVLKICEDVHPSIIARLEKEISVLNSLKSDSYPGHLYFDTFIEDPVTELRFPNRLFITIEERIHGSPLSACMDGFRNEKSVVELLIRLVTGLRLLWDSPQSIVHRDLKPDNILIREDGYPVIIDLGIVREEGSAGITVSHFQIGPCTPAYASPEQATNKKRFINFRSDFFALGVICYELLSKSHPFRVSANDSMEEILGRVIGHHPPPLSKLGICSDAFSQIVGRLMTKEPYQRHRTVDSLLADLKKISEDNQP